MEFTNEIFFNKNLIQNETVLITYSGKLYREHSAEVTIVYGFGDNWDYTSEAKMYETENGFEVSITLKNYNTFNFCFKNNYNIWDNNSGFNYIAAIEEAKKPIENNQTIPENQEITINNEITVENTNDTLTKDVSANEKNDEIEKAFSALLDSILEFNNTEENTEDVNLENGFGLQSVDEIKETDFESCDDIFNDLYNELTKNIEPDNSEINKSNIIIEDSKNTSTSELETLLNDFSEKQQEKEKAQIMNSEELDKLMDNILDSIIEDNENQQNENNLEQATEPQSQSEQSNLPVAQSNTEDFLDKCIDASYNFFKKVWVGCKKVGLLIKEKAKQLLSEEK